MLDNLDRLEVPSLSERIEQKIAGALLTGELRPGSRLVESALAGKLGVSRSPVREALVALERKGIVTSESRRGYSVAEFTEKDVQEIYSLRLLLETAALRRGFGQTEKPDLAEGEAILNRLREASEQGADRSTIVSLDMEFHEWICRSAQHSRILSAWDRLRLQTLFLMGLTTKTREKTPDDYFEAHRSIFEAIRGGDIRDAESVLAEHMLEAQRRASRSIAELEVAT